MNFVKTSINFDNESNLWAVIAKWSKHWLIFFQTFWLCMSPAVFMTYQKRIHSRGLNIMQICFDVISLWRFRTWLSCLQWIFFYNLTAFLYAWPKVRNCNVKGHFFFVHYLSFNQHVINKRKIVSANTWCINAETYILVSSHTEWHIFLVSLTID